MPSSKKYNKSKGKAKKNAAAAFKNSSGLSKILNHRLSPKQQRRASQMSAKMFKCTLESMEKLASAYDTLMFGDADEDDAFLEIHFLTMFRFMTNNSVDRQRLNRSRFNLWLWEDWQKDVVHYPFTRQRNFGEKSLIWRFAIELLSISRRYNSVSFNNSVDVRVSLTSYKVDKKTTWYTIDEISSMKNQALCRKSPLRFSDTPMKVSSEEQEHIISSPPPPLRHSSSWNEQPIEISQLKRVHSAAAQLNRMPTNTTKDIGYNEHICELDKEVYINNEERRNNSRQRLHHYSRVMGELDRQFDEGYRQINQQELAGVSKAISSNAYFQAIERARKESTIAQAILLGNEKEVIATMPNTMLNRAA